MPGFENILVYVDTESEDHPALDRAVDIAKDAGGSLTLATVLEPLPKFATLILSETSKDIEAIIADEVKEKLDALAAPLREDGVAVETTLLSGHTAIEIIRQVLRGGHDLVLKGGDVEEHGDTISHRDMQLLRKCPCTVWLMRLPSAGKIERILATIDPEPGDTVRNALNEKIMEVAGALASEEKCGLDALRAWGLEGTTMHLARLSQEELDAYMERVEATYRETLDDFLEDLADRPENLDVHVIKGAAEAVIPEWVAQHKPDVIVMGTVARTGIAGFLIGNTAERVLQQVACSIIALKPDGFETPVRIDE